MPQVRKKGGTPLQMFQEEWGECVECELHETRDRLVLGKGDVPAKILFVGEAPGASENVLGRPFVGPAGKLLDRIIREAIRGPWCPVCAKPCYESPSGITCPNGHGGSMTREEFAELPEIPTLAFTNVICCIPLGEEGSKVAVPPHESVMACKPRLEKFIELCDPRLIVSVGKFAMKYLEQGYHHSVRLNDRNTPILEIHHPAFILRANPVQQQMLYKECVVQLKDAIEDYC